MTHIKTPLLCPFRGQTIGFLFVCSETKAINLSHLSKIYISMIHYNQCAILIVSSATHDAPIFCVDYEQSQYGKLMTENAYILQCMRSKSRKMQVVAQFLQSSPIGTKPLVMHPVDPCDFHFVGYCPVNRSVSICHIICVPHSPNSRRCPRNVCHPYSLSPRLIIPNLFLSFIAHAHGVYILHNWHLPIMIL